MMILNRNVSIYKKMHDIIKIKSCLSTTTTINNDKPKIFKSLFLQTLNERGYIHQCTDYNGLDEKLFTDNLIKAYLGFDATAGSLHVGSLLQIMILRIFQKTGHKPIILIGGGTTKIGDPSGKDESRQLLTNDNIISNSKSLEKVFQKYIKFGNNPTDAILVNNADWLDKINYIEFLRDYGKHFTINRMLSFESVKMRLARDQPLTFLEFNYMLLQAYDFLELNRRLDITLQLGGSDQWGNIVNGIELTRKVDQTHVFGLTAPLIMTSDGKKMGKSTNGAIWLNKDLLSEYDYWQFWRNVSDDDVIKFLKLFTEVSMEEIIELEKCQGNELNKVKIRLADEATGLLHGKECLELIHSTVNSLFSNNSNGNELDALEKFKLSIDDVSNINNNGNILVVNLLILADLTKSKAEGKRLIKGGGVKVNDEKIIEDTYSITSNDFDNKGRLKLSLGKKKHVLILI